MTPRKSKLDKIQTKIPQKDLSTTSNLISLGSGWSIRNPISYYLWLRLLEKVFSEKKNALTSKTGPSSGLLVLCLNVKHYLSLIIFVRMNHTKSDWVWSVRSKIKYGLFKADRSGLNSMCGCVTGSEVCPYWWQIKMFWSVGQSTETNLACDWSLMCA